MNSNRGFSLIEVVVAVMILSIASVAILRHFSQSLYAIGRSTAVLGYGDALKVYYQDAVREYTGGVEDELSYETDDLVFRFTFADPEFLKAEDYPTIAGIKMKEITAVVVRKSDNHELFRQVTYHVLPVRAK